MDNVFDIVMFNIDGFLNNPYVFEIFNKNLEVFEEYGEKNNIEFRWHFVDNESLKEIAENFNLLYTKRLLNKDEYCTDEVKFFLATQYENYITFPLDMRIIVVDELFKNKNIIDFYRNQTYYKYFNINENSVIKCMDKDSELIKRILHYFKRTFQGVNSDFHFFSKNISEILKSDFDDESNKILDFEKPESYEYFVYCPINRVDKALKYFQNQKKPFDMDWVYFSKHILDSHNERKYGATVTVVCFSVEPQFLDSYNSDDFSYINAFKSNCCNIYENDAFNELSDRIELYYKRKCKQLDLELINADEDARPVIPQLREYINKIYEKVGHKFNIYSVIDFENAVEPVFGITGANFWSDICYENRKNPNEFIPLPYLDEDDAVQQLCW